MTSDRSLRSVSSAQLDELLRGEQPVVVLLPCGSVEPHGPHLGLLTDTTISVAAATRAATVLTERALPTFVAPAVPYGVTECANGFAGAVSVSGEALTAYLRAVVQGLLGTGFAHVCLVNNHLEPAHDAAVRAAVESLDSRSASVACPLTRRWARTLSAEFKSGACHAGRYETSIMMAADPVAVDEAVRAQLPEVPVSLSAQLAAGVCTFAAMGMDRAYAGAPAQASAQEGEQLISLLATMVATEVLESFE